MDAELVNAIREKYAALEPFLNERTKCLWAAVEAKALGQGGKAWVAAATHLSRITLYRGLRELDQSLEAVSDSRIRAEGGGVSGSRSRDVMSWKHSKVWSKIPPGVIRSPLYCGAAKYATTCRYPSSWLPNRTAEGFGLLSELGYSLQGNRTTKAGRDHPDRDRQFHYLTRRVKLFQALCAAGDFG
jgi:DDE family transposase